MAFAAYAASVKSKRASTWHIPVGHFECKAQSFNEPAPDSNFHEGLTKATLKQAMQCSIVILAV